MYPLHQQSTIFKNLIQEMHHILEAVGDLN